MSDGESAMGIPAGDLIQYESKQSTLKKIERLLSDDQRSAAEGHDL